MAVLGPAAMADPVTELRCAEAAWQQASSALQDNRDAVWDRMNIWLDRTAQADCAALSDPDQSFVWFCGEADARFEAVLSLEPVDRERLGRVQGWSFVFTLVKAFETPEMTEVFAQLEEDLTEVVEDLAAVGVTVTPTEPEPEDEVPEMSLSDIMADINPLQNSLGLTATLTWPEETEENARARIDDVMRINEMLLSFERGDPTRGNTVAQATAARAQVIALAAQQADFWSDAHMPLAASRFQLFDRPMDVVRPEVGSIAVIDIASWSRTPDVGGPMIEGVEEMVFYYDPQPGLAQSLPGDGDCKVLKTFPCPPLNGGAPEQMGVLGDIPNGCNSAEGCTFTSLRWVSDHVAVRTYLQARQADSADLEQFAARLPTLRTKSLLTAFAPDAAFDPVARCR